ncbi:zinc-dependent alcohol dehydrogenase [Aeromicrobium wangtongii]|uniref:zinc-dependent alcohol dehydrogenase n=1 Tax=Aeromicrobium wangtongii TaxID=2969247 RepID=UPI002017AC03|nr:alcohol dehydrogenase catalytic domain-containing protein [Aeromicrobium wangtongii]MCL3818604.1 alcohol dehydrogenase catalytic domain-containing protein [Aeromicrobium wangtongii]
MRAGVFQAARTFDITQLDVPAAGRDGIVVQVAACGICGSDLHSYVEGVFVEPGQVMGHEFSGPIVEVGADVEGLSVGDRVTAVPLSVCGRCPRCIEGMGHLCETGLSQSIAYGLPGAFAEYVRVPNAVLGKNVFLIPDSVSDAAAAMVEPMAVALHAARSADPDPADTAVVIGLGSIGLNAVQMLKALGAGRVIGIDVSDSRLALATRLGADVIVDGRTQNGLAAVQELTGVGVGGVGARADIVIEASGIGALLAEAVSMTRAGGRLRIAALYEGAVTLDANQVVQKEMSVRGTFAYNGEFPTVLEMLADGRVTAEPLITHTFRLDDLDAAFRAQLDKNSSIKVQVTP